MQPMQPTRRQLGALTAGVVAAATLAFNAFAPTASAEENTGKHDHDDHGGGCGDCCCCCPMCGPEKKAAGCKCGCCAAGDPEAKLCCMCCKGDEQKRECGCSCNGGDDTDDTDGGKDKGGKVKGRGKHKNCCMCCKECGAEKTAAGRKCSCSHPGDPTAELCCTCCKDPNEKHVTCHCHCSEGADPAGMRR